MTTVQTIELSDKERLTIEDFLNLADEISDIAKCSMSDVFEYFADNADIIGEYKHSIGALHQISDIG